MTSPIASTFGTAMLGLTLECARCHDHKFDAITQRDYFSLFAFFNSIDESGLYSHFTNATPSPSILLWPVHEQAAHSAIEQRIAATEARLRRLARQAEPGFRAWRASAAKTSPLPPRRGVSPVAHLALDTVDGDTTPDSVAKAGAALQDAPVLVEDAEASGGKAMRFSGDNSVAHLALRAFSRTDAFSIGLRIKPIERQARAVVVHQSNTSATARWRRADCWSAQLVVRA